MRDLTLLEQYRQADDELRLWGGQGGSTEGYFMIHHPASGSGLRVIASCGDGWEHVSVSLETRCPTWAEMDHVKRMFFQDDEVVMQLHVATRDHINCHPFCLHLWRPLGGKIPLPPHWMVG